MANPVDLDQFAQKFERAASRFRLRASLQGIDPYYASRLVRFADKFIDVASELRGFASFTRAEMVCRDAEIQAKKGGAS
jgi:hypothetical protein